MQGMIIKYKYILNENEKEINIKQFLINKKKKTFPCAGSNPADYVSGQFVQSEKTNF